jgi:hypothetical protein
VSESNKTSRCVNFTHREVYYFHSRQSFIAFTHRDLLLLSLTTKFYCFYTPWSVIVFNLSLTTKFYCFYTMWSCIAFNLSFTTKSYCFYTPWSFITFTHDKVLLLLHTVKKVTVCKSNKTLSWVKVIKLHGV